MASGALLRSFLFVVIFGGLPAILMAQKTEIYRVDPPHWFAGMQNDTLYLLVKGAHLSDKVVVDGKTVSVIESQVSENKDYLHLWLLLSPTAPAQKVKFEVGAGRNKTKFLYEIKARNQAHGAMQGLSQKDFIYLITPDRFVNGNPKNDAIKGMQEPTVNRAEPYARHGGDIAGIQQKLDYIKNLGVTAIWSNPLLENDQPKESYHGYAITDNYIIDPRFGTNEEFYNLVKVGHQKGIKTIMDMVYNHIGDRHYLVQSPPDSGWFNWWPAYTQTNYRATTLMDPYASEFDKAKLQNGWFDKHMADLNQKHPAVAKWLIQNSIWLIEEFDLDAFRIDTYAYPDQDFMSRLNKAVLNQYPNFFIFAETWVHGHPVQSFFPGNNPNRADETHLQSVTDFQLHYAINDAINQPFGWTEGVNRIYYTLAADWLYSKPENLVTFVDNHDLARFYGVTGKNLSKFKIGMGLLLTLRGIPSMYYGTEVLMAETDGHGKIREDFSGGWPGDAMDKFDIANRTAEENQAFGFIKSLANYRKTSKALTEGKLIQFVPVEGVYVYFRVHPEQTIMIVVNSNPKIQAVKMEDFAEVAGGFKKTKSVLTGFEAPIMKYLNTGEMSISIFELVK
jgi:glycosidase